MSDYWYGTLAKRLDDEYAGPDGFVIAVLKRLAEGEVAETRRARREREAATAPQSAPQDPSRLPASATGVAPASDAPSPRAGATTDET